MTGDALIEVEFERIIEILNRRKVSYVVIGGVAAILQGVDLPRTVDIDITPASDLSNKKRLASALRELGAKLRVPGTDEAVEIPLDERTFSGMVTMTFTTIYGPFDISFVPDGTTGFDDLNEHSTTIERSGLKIPVSSIADIARSKRAAGRQKDVRHLQILLDFIEDQEG